MPAAGAGPRGRFGQGPSSGIAGHRAGDSRLPSRIAEALTQSADCAWSRWRWRQRSPIRRPRSESPLATSSTRPSRSRVRTSAFCWVARLPSSSCSASLPHPIGNGATVVAAIVSNTVTAPIYALAVSAIFFDLGGRATAAPAAPGAPPPPRPTEPPPPPPAG